MWRNTMGDCLTPSARAARTWSLERWASIEPRSRRAKIGISTTAMATMTVHWLGRGASAAIETASSSDGIESMTSTDAHHERVDPAAERPGDDAQGHAADEAEDGGEDADDEGLAAADQQAREHVAAAAVRAEREAGLRAGNRVALWSDLVQEQPGSGVVRGDPRGEKIASTMNSRVTAAPMRKMGSRRSRRHALAMRETPAESSTAPASLTARSSTTVPTLVEPARSASSSIRCFLR